MITTFDVKALVDYHIWISKPKFSKDPSVWRLNYPAVQFVCSANIKTICCLKLLKILFTFQLVFSSTLFSMIKKHFSVIDFKNYIYIKYTLTFCCCHSYTYYSEQLSTYIFLLIFPIVWADAWIIHLFSLFVLQTLPKTICCLKFKRWTVRCQMFCICSIYVPWPQQQWPQKKRSQTLPQKNWGLQPQLCSFYIDR